MPLPTVEDWLYRQQFNLDVDDWVQDLLSQQSGYMIIAGRTGIGKTVLALQLAHSLATGTPFFGLETKQCRVGFLAFEGADAKMGDRFYKVRRNYPLTEGRLRFSIESPIKLKLQQALLTELVQGCDVVFFDPVKYMVTGDYIKPNIANEFAQMILNFSKQNNIVTVLLLQIRKPNENSLIYPGDSFNIKGAADYVESAASVLVLERKPQGHKKGKQGKGFAKVNNDNIMLYFDKHRDSIGGLPERELLLNREKLLFEEIEPTKGRDVM